MKPHIVAPPQYGDTPKRLSVKYCGSHIVATPQCGLWGKRCVHILPSISTTLFPFPTHLIFIHSYRTTVKHCIEAFQNILCSRINNLDSNSQKPSRPRQRIIDTTPIKNAPTAKRRRQIKLKVRCTFETPIPGAHTNYSSKI